ncbi:hypothetical protein ACJIZ3_001466 [Penstemon smallii]|uniref:Dynamin-related protein 3A-like n=1 Tax=Penstemon smallii TaxID=265156 RepID=A0ABD3U6D3_9LAMI
MEEKNLNDSGRTNPLPASAFIGSSVVPIVNKLQDIFAPLEKDDLTEFNLPQVAVVGSQSSGKSSVLEALVGRDFLPRGCDICTRRPLLLQLQRNSGTEEWGEFRHLPNKRFYDFSEIRREIQVDTEKEVGKNREVSDKEIRLKIFSPNVLNITLVDLPGITKVPVGNQPSDIETRIKNLMKVYIKQENCIILAVSPANSDLATSDALQIAKEVDPTGFRTLGVITKLDIMDKGTDACKFLLGKVVPLRLGYVGVVNRSQEDIHKNRSIAEAFAYEELFFKDHPIYNSVSDRCGIRQLAKKLSQILEQHIRIVLPKFKSELNSRLVAVIKELHTYGDVMESKGEQGAVLSNILTKYCEAFSAMVDGKNQEMSTKELSGGARIKYIFQSSFVKCLEEVDPCEDITDDDIRIAILNATGPRNALFVPEGPFENLVRRQISRLLEPSLQCLHYVHEELLRISYACEPIEMQRFPILRRRLDDILKKFLHEGVKAAERMIGNLIDMEMSYINSSHPKFIGGKNAVELALQHGRASQKGNDLEQQTRLESGQKSQESLIKPEANGVFPNQGGQPQSYSYKAATATAGFLTTRIRGISSVFGSRGQPSMENSYNGQSAQTMQESEASVSIIQLNKLPSNLRLLETQTEDETVEVMVTKLLLTSYYDIVRKNVQDLVPKAIMHFLVNYTKSNLLGTCIRTLYSTSSSKPSLLPSLAKREGRRKLGQLAYCLNFVAACMITSITWVISQ